ncbi:hypothetical protein JOM56_010955 [Amanita muscaria]
MPAMNHLVFELKKRHPVKARFATKQRKSCRISFPFDLHTVERLPELPLRERREHLPVLDATANPNIDDKDRFVAIKMGSVDRASEKARLGMEDTSATDDPVAKDEIDKQVLQDVIQESKRQVEAMRTIGGGVQKAADYGTQSTVILDKADMAANFLKPLKAFDSVVKGLADVHPYAKVALSVLCWASQAIITQANRDKSIQDLQSRIADVYEFMLGEGRLAELISMKDILSHASQVMFECAKFIQVYSQPNFCKSATSAMNGTLTIV